MVQALSSPRRLLAALIALLLIAAGVALATLDPAAPRATAAEAPKPPAEAASKARLPEPEAKPPRASGRTANGSRLVATNERRMSRGTGSGSSTASFASRYPAQAAATYDPAIPATNYWALLIGINDYAGSTRDNIGSYQDARQLRKHLMSQGWKSDHIALVANRDATVPRIMQGLRWLASKTDSSSVVVFHYSGHEMPVRSSADGDREARDVAIWASDNRLLLDGVLGRELGRVRASKMWINLAVCRAGGFTDAGMIKPGRVITFSSPEKELSYEDPQVRHSVYGWFTLMEGMRQGLGDANGDGRVTVEEAYTYGRPYVIQRTGGAQHPMITDKLSGSFYLDPPKPAPPPPSEPPPSDSNDGGCILCPRTSAVRREY